MSVDQHFISQSEKLPRTARVFGFLQGALVGLCIGMALEGHPAMLFFAIVPAALCALASHLWD